MGESIKQLSLLSFTRTLVVGLSGAPSKLGVALKQLLDSPLGVVGTATLKQGTPYPLPLPFEAWGALCGFRDGTVQCKRRKAIWKQCELAWWGLVVFSLNSSGGFTTRIGEARGPLQKEVLSALLVDACRFVSGDGLSKEVVRGPEVCWSARISDLSLSYSGEVCEKARWLTWPQVEPGLPPPGKGACLFAPDFCDEWVGTHLLNAELSRLDDSDVVDPLPYAVVRATQSEWETIGRALLERGVATVIKEKDIATCRGQKILNGAFGVVKPGKWVGDPADNKPVLRLIMDFRCANVVHRMLPGAVDSLVGPSKWQGLTLNPNEFLVASGDDLVACFYLFRIPFSWSRYFAFRKPISRGALGLPGDPEELVYLASQVLPMGWAAAVTVVQHIHRGLALRDDGLPEEREIHRQRPLPEKGFQDDGMFWNLYIDDLTLLEVVNSLEVDSSGKIKRSVWQEKMEQIYEALGVPYSREKASSREMICEKLGRSRPPKDPAGIHHTPEEAKERWRNDDYRFPPYTYKLEYCLWDGLHARVCGAAEREVLMGFKPGHTSVKVKGKMADQDLRCAAVGNSFHTGVVASILKCCLRPFLPHHPFPSQEELALSFYQELSRVPAEIFTWCGDKPKQEDTESWLDRLEQQSDAVPKSLPALELQLVAKILAQCSYRGTDVHLDTLTFYRPDRLPISPIDARQWVWKISKGWAWKKTNHINILEMEALYHTIKFRAKGGRILHRKFLHLVDSQVVLGIVAKGRSSSLRLQRSLHKYNLLVLALHCYPVLGWVVSALNPADAPSRWYEHLARWCEHP